MSTLLAAEAPSAGGAAIDQVIIATVFGMFITVLLAVLCLGHRSGRIGVLAALGRFGEKVSPLPGWAAVPAGMALVTLLPTLFGLQWDESLHIGQGRDEGPLANPSHYLLLQGIFGAFAAGVIGMAMADDRMPRSAIQIPGAWKVPVGSALAAVGAGVALIGFPLDDVWHRFYGQDVTLWSPTHVTMIVGVSISVIGILISVIEGLRVMRAERLATAARAPQPNGVMTILTSVIRGWRKNAAAQQVPADANFAKPEPRPVWADWALAVTRLTLFVMVPAALLLVISLLQGEFDFGVGQYRLLFHPLTMLGGAALAMVAARIIFGPGAALAAAIGFIVIRGVIAILVGPVLGEADHYFPLYLAEAACVELAALAISTRKPLAFGALAGGLIGTVGLAAEWAYSGVFPYEWTAALLPEVLILAPVISIAGGIIGAWMGSHLMLTAPIRTVPLRNAAVASAVVVTGIIFWGLQEGEQPQVSGSVELTEVVGGAEPEVDARITLTPADAADDVEWFKVISWQGDGLINTELTEVEPGVWETDNPVPVYGNWKTAFRIHDGDALIGLPIFLPEDEAIPVEEVPALASFEREFVGEKVLLQREAKEVGAGMQSLGTILVALICFALMGLTAAAVHRMAATEEGAGPDGIDAEPDVGGRSTAAADDRETALA